VSVNKLRHLHRLVITARLLSYPLNHADPAEFQFHRGSADDFLRPRAVSAHSRVYLDGGV
jgi:hypothetical protein